MSTRGVPLGCHFAAKQSLLETDQTCATLPDTCACVQHVKHSYYDMRCYASPCTMSAQRCAAANGADRNDAMASD
eukprot:1508519-Amphidinium_carterae.1